jgi:alpha-N-arabinofuranosidase
MKSGKVVYSCLAAATCIALVTCLAGALTHHHASSGSVSLAVGKDGGNKSSSLLYGMMFEVRNSHLSFVEKSLIIILAIGNGPFR